MNGPGHFSEVIEDIRRTGNRLALPSRPLQVNIVLKTNFPVNCQHF
jgi:hypothetical protein